MALSRRKLLVAAAAGVPIGALLLGRRTEDGTMKPTQEPVAAGAREVAQIVGAQPTMDGAGVSLRRALGSRALDMLDPFLLLDEFQSDDPNDYIAGFPDHPHRGFETVTYMLEGAMEHRDSVGNRGRLGAGSAQWMTAGRGIIHSEMPKQERGLMWGYQLWVNLPAARKLIRPRYQDIPAQQIPALEHEGAQVRVVAGSAFGRTGPVSGIDVDPTFLDLSLAKGVSLSHALPATHTALAYVIEGAVRIGSSGREARQGELAVLGPGERFVARCDADKGRLLLLAGKPLREPVSRSGPFVMNTHDEIRRAWADYRSGRLLDG
jgi:quercetin 2,3-dioxygenase